jgi:hypothetical protein
MANVRGAVLLKPPDVVVLVKLLACGANPRFLRADREGSLS